MEIDNSYNWEYTKKYDNGTPKEIIVHHMAGNGTIFDIDRMHTAKGWRGVGYHFFIDKNGNAFYGRPVSEYGAHCAGHNFETIGVCFEGNFENTTMNDVQFYAGVDLLTYLMKKYNITKVTRHKDYMPTACPGKFFPFDSLLEELDYSVFWKGDEEEVNYVAHKPSTWAKTAAEWMIDSGFLKGDENGDIYWQKPVTMEQLAMVLYRIHVGDEKKS